jgi:hypothetical protein
LSLLIEVLVSKQNKARSNFKRDLFARSSSDACSKEDKEASQQAAQQQHAKLTLVKSTWLLHGTELSQSGLRLLHSSELTDDRLLVSVDWLLLNAPELTENRLLLQSQCVDSNRLLHSTESESVLTDDGLLQLNAAELTNDGLLLLQSKGVDALHTHLLHLTEASHTRVQLLLKLIHRHLAGHDEADTRGATGQAQQVDQ